MSFRRDAIPASVVDLLLKSAPTLKQIDRIYLAGGTALSLYLGHRISIDLDFFAPGSFSVDAVEERLKQIGSYSQKRIAEDTLLCTIDNVQLSVFKYSYPLLGQPIEFEGMAIASLRDIAAMKVVAVGHRGTRKDFYDLYALLNLASLKMDDILQDVLRKYALSRDGLYHYIRSLGFFEDAEKEPDIQSQVKMEISWPQIETYFSVLVRTLIP